MFGETLLEKKKIDVKLKVPREEDKRILHEDFKSLTRMFDHHQCKDLSMGKCYIDRLLENPSKVLSHPSNHNVRVHPSSPCLNMRSCENVLSTCSVPMKDDHN